MKHEIDVGDLIKMQSNDTECLYIITSVDPIDWVSVKMKAIVEKPNFPVNLTIKHFTKATNEIK